MLFFSLSEIGEDSWENVASVFGTFNKVEKRTDRSFGVLRGGGFSVQAPVGAKHRCSAEVPLSNVEVLT